MTEEMSDAEKEKLAKKILIVLFIGFAVWVAIMLLLFR